MKILTNDLTRQGLCLFTLFLVAIQSTQICFAVSVNEANIAIAGAEGDLGLAFTRTAEAEDAGVDISELLSTLTEADNFLLKAQVSYRDEDYQAAESFAIKSSQIAKTVADEASLLTLGAEKEHDAVVFFTLAACWKLLKRRHLQSFGETQPKVVES